MNNFEMTTLTTAIATPFPTPMGRVFDDIIVDAKVGDVLRCTYAVTGDSFFTEGETYPVISGESMFTAGMPTIEDNGGVEVPYGMPGRIFLGDLFEFVTDDTVVEFPVPAVVTETDPELVQWAVKGIEAEIHELNETYANLIEELDAVNTFDESTAILFKNLPDSDKAALLLAQHDGKPIQSFPTLTWATRWGGTNGTFKDDLFYRVRPSSVDNIYAELSATNSRIDELYEKLDELREDEEDDFDW